MSLKITVPGGTFDLPPGFSTEIEDKSPAFNEEGSQSIATTVPGTKGNLKLCAHINRTDIDNAPARDQRAVVADGVYHRAGKMNIVSASRGEGITFNIGFAESELYRIWNAVSLQSLKLPVYRPEAPDPGQSSSPVVRLCEALMGPNRDPDLPLEIFPVALSVNVTQEDGMRPTWHRDFTNPPENKVTRTYSEFVNTAWRERSEKFFINGSAVEVSLPEGYGCVPFLRVSYILERIFASYGFRVIENPFATHHQLRRLVVLNNAADCCVKGELRYSDLMPDCSINEFMQALWCRFGLLFFVNPNTRAVRLKFIRDILRAPHAEDWTLLKAALPVVHYEEPRQLKLSAATNVSGPSARYSARTPVDSLDHFLTPYHYTVSARQGAFLRYDPLCGAYYRRELTTDGEEFLTSEFFPWDRGHDMSYREITSVDECLPAAPLPTGRLVSSPDNPRFKVPEEVHAPLYLFGKVHRYTSITSSDIDLPEDVQYRTPLAFCFAFSGTGINPGFIADIGSQFCLDAQGNPFTDSAGRKHDISLTFVGKYGLFNHFWKEYDAMLRHAGHVVETDIRLSAHQRMNPDFSAPVLFDGQRMLPDTVGYTLPAHHSCPAKVRLRTLKLLKPCPVVSEQSIPIVEQRYTWRTFDNKEAAIASVVADALARHTAEIRKYLGVSNCHLSYRHKPIEELIPRMPIPFSTPSESDYQEQKEYLLCKVTYKFTLSYDLVEKELYTSGIVPIANLRAFISALGSGEKFQTEYDKRIRADLF